PYQSLLPRVRELDCFASIAMTAPGLRRGANLPHRPLGLDVALCHDAIAAAFLGLVERAVAAVDQIFHGLAELELPHPDRHGDAGQRLAGGAAGALATGRRVPGAFGAARTWLRASSAGEPAAPHTATSP